MNLTVRTNRLFVLLAAAAVICCGRVKWQQSSIGTVPDNSNWYLNGGILYVTPQAHRTYEDNAQALMAKYLGSTISVPFPEGQYYVDNRKQMLGPGEFLIRPTTMTITPIESKNEIAIKIGFDDSAAVISLSNEGCQLTVSIQGLSVMLTLAAVRDLAGNIAMMTSGNADVSITTVTTSVGHKCDNLSDDGAFAMRGTSGFIATEAVTSVLTKESGFLQATEQMMTALMVGRPMGHLNIEIPDIEGSDSEFNLAVLPMSNDGAEPVVLVAANRIVTPMKIGLHSVTNSCVKHLNFPKPATVDQVAPPEMLTGSSDVVLAVRRTLVNDVFNGLFSAGLMCSNLGFETETELVLSQIANLLATNPITSMGENSPVSVRLWPESVPQFEISTSELTSEMRWDKVRVEVYVRHWDTDWSVFNNVLSVTVKGLKPILNVDGSIHLAGGSFEAVTENGESHNKLAELALMAVTNKMQILQLPQLYPYPLSNAKFELMDDYIVMYADLDTNGVPDKRVITAGATQPPPDTVSADSGATGCQVTSIKTPRSPPWAWAFGMVLVFVGIFALRRNDAH